MVMQPACDNNWGYIPWQAHSPALPSPSLFSHNFVIFSLSSLITLFCLCRSLPLSVCLCNFGTYVSYHTPAPNPAPCRFYHHPVAFSFSPPSFLFSHPSRHPWAAQAELQPSLSGVDELNYLIFMGEIIWKCVCVCQGQGGLQEREVMERLCVCVLVRDGGWRVYRVYMRHHYHIKDMLGFLS